MEKNCSTARIITISVVVVSIIVGMTISAFMLSRFMLRIQNTTEKSITVKGVAEKEVKADLASFSCTLKVSAKEKSVGFAKLNNAQAMLDKKLEMLGFTKDMRFDESITCAADYNIITQRDNGVVTERREFAGYDFTYLITIRTSNVALVTENVLKINTLVRNNVDVTVSEPQYFVKNPEQYKLELVNLASASAAERAKVAASQSGSSLGPLMTARQGVIQITSPASTETSDYGVYNTSSPVKIIRLVMTMTFNLK